MDTDVAANWTGDVLPTTTDVALFDNSVLATLPSTLLNSTTNQTWGSIIWNSNDAGTLTMTGSGGNRTLGISGGGGSSAAIAAGGAAGDLILVGTNKTSGTFSINGTNGTGTSRMTLSFAASGNINVVGASVTLLIGSQITGLTAANSTLTKTGAGTLTLSNGNNNIFSGSNTGKKFILDGGTLNFNNAGGFSGSNGSSTFEIHGGTSLDNSTAAAITLNANNPQSWTGDFTYKGSGNSLNLGTGAVTMSGSGTARTVTVSANSLTVGGAIGDGGANLGLTKEGAGTLILNGANTYTGKTTVNGGSLQLGGGADRINTATEVAIANGTSGSNSGILNLAGQNQTVAALSSIVNGAGTTKGTVRNTTTATTATLTVTGTSTFDGIIRDNSGSGTGKVALTKSTGGTLTLTGANTYTGATTISGGTLLVNGSLASGSAVGVGSGGTLAGSGSVGGLVTTAGTGSILSAGDGVGTLSLSGGLNADAGADFVFQLGTSSDLLNLGSAVFTGSSAAGGLVFDFSNAGGLAASTAYTLLTFGSSSGLDATDLVANTLPSGFVLDSSFGSGGFQISATSLQVQFSAVPEPTTWGLLGSGLAALWVLRRKRGRENA